jgi:BirA family biotin operon repressor/biotin-[acetyl-CoA-carboxylase] ligase
MKNWHYKNFTIYHFNKLDSTNKYALESAATKKKFDHEIILSDSQNSGMGRNGRSWSSPAGNLYFSLILQPNIMADKIPQLSFVAITALRLAVERIFAEQKLPTNVIENKWPNDLLIDKKKVAGILLESKINQNFCEFVIIGIGLNLVSSPENTIFPASSLKKFGIGLSVPIALKKFLDEFENLYQNWLDFGFAGTHNLWLKQAYNFKKNIVVKNDSKQIEGIFNDLDLDGSLILESKNGMLKISAGDLLKPVLKSN